MSKIDKRIAESAPELHKRVDTAKAKAEHKIWDRDPLKQFVRKVGWLAVTNEYNRLRNNEGIVESLKILTLPGENATDIGLLFSEGLITVDSNGIMNVAICDDSAAEIVVSNLAKIGALLAYSDKSLHEALQEEASIIEQFPFDVINMDLTTPLIPEKSHFNEQAIERIFRLQRGQGFLLFLTTKPDTNPKTVGNLMKVIEHNLKAETRFLDAYIRRYGSASSDLCKNNLAEFVQVVYPKILARYGRYFGYKIKEQFIGHYSGGRGNTMVCHSFEFEPLARTGKLKYKPRFSGVLVDEISDRVYGELSSKHQQAAIDAYVDFIEFLPMHQSISVDELLKQDKALNSKMEEEASQLIKWWERVRD